MISSAKTGKKIQRINNPEVIINNGKTRHAIGGEGLLKWDLDFLNVSANEVYMVYEAVLLGLCYTSFWWLGPLVDNHPVIMKFDRAICACFIDLRKAYTQYAILVSLIHYFK